MSSYKHYRKVRYRTPEEIANEVEKLWHEIESLKYEMAKKLGLTITTLKGETVIMRT